MARPEEYIIHIDADGRITLDGKDIHETSWRRIVDLLEETVGPVRHVQVNPEDPPRPRLHREEPRRLEIEEGGR